MYKKHLKIKYLMPGVSQEKPTLKFKYAYYLRV